MLSVLENSIGGLKPPEMSEDRRAGLGKIDSGRESDALRRPDRLTISDEARDKALVAAGSKVAKGGKAQGAGKLKTEGTEKDGKGPAGELTEEEKKVVQELKKRDREVRAHEMAHLGASGGHALGGASYEYQRGPDGVQYAVGGEVAIDTSPVKGNPAATIAKAQTIKAAALAPASPSGADRAVAAAAGAMEAEARAQLSEQAVKAAGGTSEDDSDASDTNDATRTAHKPYGGEGDSPDQNPVLNLLA